MKKIMKILWQECKTKGKTMIGMDDNVKRVLDGRRMIVEQRRLIVHDGNKSKVVMNE